MSAEANQYPYRIFTVNVMVKGLGCEYVMGWDTIDVVIREREGDDVILSWLVLVALMFMYLRRMHAVVVRDSDVLCNS